MEERLVDYFVVAGLPDENPKLVDEDLCEGLNPNQQNIEPITDITVIFPGLGEIVPKGFECVETTPSGYPANLNSGSLRSPEVYLCYKRGRDKPPLVDIGVMYDGKERLLPDAEVVLSTPQGRAANVNNTSARTLLTYRRAPESMPCNELVVTDICVIFQNKGEKPPHAFCLISKNLNKGMMGCDVFLCYKKSMNRPPLIQFKPEVLLRYPPIDRRTFPFPPLTATFCLPMCATVECWPKNSLQPRPVFSTFVLTVADATEKIYGAAITFYEDFEGVDKLSEEHKEILGVNYDSASESDKEKKEREEKKLHVNKCICVLSHYAFFDAFKTFLCYLNWMMRNGAHPVPIERYISHLLQEVPYPSPQRPHIFMQLSPSQYILFSHPHDTPFPKSGASFRSMLSNLGTENCLLVMLLVLTEQKLLIHSLRPDVLTNITEAISVLIFPFRWQCPYVPLCPLGLCGVLQAPVPFLIGVDSRFFDLYEPPNDVTCIDLDTNTITVSEDKRYLLSNKLLPKKPARILKNTLEMIKSVSDRVAMMHRMAAKGKNDTTEAMDIDFQQKRRERAIEVEIQEAFLRFMTMILKGYRQCLLPITKAPTITATDASSLFDFQGFLRSRDKTYHKFYQLMLKTQMFIRFIEERSFVSENDNNLEFFDECVEKIEADETETVKLWESNEANQNDRTVFVMPPEPTDLPPNSEYSYNNKFVVDEGLFITLKLKSNELDRVLQLAEQGSPGSPVAKRTKQEIRSAQKIAKKYSEKPLSWAKYLLSTCYSIWFIHLPSYVSLASSKHMALCMAYDMLTRMTNYGLQPADEVCYRVVMQLCGIHNQPVIAVKVLLRMKRCGITPNALTYGYYNKAVLEAEWPSNVTTSSQLMWNKLRNVVIGVAHFRAAAKHHRHSVDDTDRVSVGSGGSTESHSRTRHVTSLLGLKPNANGNGGVRISQSDSEVASVSTPTVPTRISSSSDVGYSSMQEQKLSSDDIARDAVQSETSRQEKAAKFWGRMGQSLDQWVKSGVSSLASLAAETSYYSQSGILIGAGLGGLGYAGDFSSVLRPGQYENEDDDEEEEEEELPKQVEVKGKSRKRLDFGDDKDNNQSQNQNQTQEKNDSQTARLLRSISFGNDTQFLTKLKLFRDDSLSSDKKSVTPEKDCSEKVAGGDKLDSVEEQEKSTNVAPVEAKVNQYYETSESTKDKNASGETVPNENQEAQINRSKSPQIPAESEDDGSGSPSRKIVTGDDPLGALSQPPSPEKGNNASIDAVKNAGQPQNRDSPKRTCSEGHIGGISEKSLMGPPEPPKGFHRSSTLPNYANTLRDPSGSNSSVNSVPSDEKLSGGLAPGAGGLAMFSSNLKNPFGRYSPGRLSLRKAGSSFLESTIGGRKAEALMEGFSQFKSAATVTMKTKLEELKEAVGNNNTPGKTGPFGRYEEGRNPDQTDDLDPEPQSDQWASVSESYLDQLLAADPDSTRASFASVDYGGMNGIHESPLSSSRNSLLHTDQVRIGILGVPASATRSNVLRPPAIEINMTTCSLCHNCASLLFDEEIMAGWTAEDSNLNTRCPHCKKWEVPFLEVTVVDYRHNPMPQVINLTTAPSLESVAASRRTSVVHPSVATPLQSTAPAPTISQPIPLNKPSQNGGEMVSEELDGNQPSTNAQEGTPPAAELDPLGVLEELHRSRKTSPETEKPPPVSVQDTEPINNPKIAIVSTSETNNNPVVPNMSETQIPEFAPIDLEGVSSEPIVVPYLSPLVLRKELENVLDHEGDSSLLQSQFVDEHPIIYWNMVWYFHRSNLPSHIKGLSLQAKTVKRNKMVKKGNNEDGGSEQIEEKNEGLEEEPFSIHPSWEGIDHRNVKVNCYWDNTKYHEQFTIPLYSEWFRMKEREKKDKENEDNQEEREVTDKEKDINKLITTILRSAQGNTLAQTCPQLLFHYHKQSKGRHYPAYRDILFLSLVAGRDSVEAYGYGLDREYRDVYSKLRNNDDYETFDVGDTPVSDPALFCRRYFRELLLPVPKREI